MTLYQVVLNDEYGNAPIFDNLEEARGCIKRYADRTKDRVPGKVILDSEDEFCLIGGKFDEYQVRIRVIEISLGKIPEYWNI